MKREMPPALEAILWPDDKPEWAWNDRWIIACRRFDGAPEDHRLIIVKLIFTWRVCPADEWGLGVPFVCYEHLHQAVTTWMAWPDIMPGFTRHVRADLSVEYPPADLPSRPDSGKLVL